MIEEIVELSFDDYELFPEWYESDDIVLEEEIDGAHTSKKLIIETSDQGNSNWKISVPKQLKYDIRRDYISMFVNAANAYDIPKIESFLKTYGRKSFSYNHVTAEQLLCLPTKFYTSGITPMVDYWKGLFKITPDSSIAIDNTNVIQYGNNHDSFVVANARTEGTLVHNLPLNSWLPSVNVGIIEQRLESRKKLLDLYENKGKNKKLKKKELKRKKSSKFSYSLISELLPHDREVFGPDLEILPKIKSFDILYTVRLFLDQNFYIYRCEYEVTKTVFKDFEFK